MRNMWGRTEGDYEGVVISIGKYNQWVGVSAQQSAVKGGSGTKTGASARIHGDLVISAPFYDLFVRVLHSLGTLEWPWVSCGCRMLEHGSLQG